MAAAQTSRIENLLSSARTLNPDLTPDILEARFADLAHRRAQATRYVPTHRHTIQVDFADYLRALRKERRVRRAGRPLGSFDFSNPGNPALAR